MRSTGRVHRDIFAYPGRNLYGPKNWLRLKAREAKNHQITPSYSFLFGPTSAGRLVTERSAMQVTVVYSCVRILAEAIAGLLEWPKD